MDNQEKYEEWLTEEFLLDDYNRTPEVQERLVKLYDYLQSMKDFEDNIEDNQE